MSRAAETDRRASVKARAPVCRHCGAPSPDGEFCCQGCAYVYRLIHEAGLDAYYRIKDEVTVPADGALLPARDYGWLQEAQCEAEKLAGERTAELRLDVQGISCAGCVWLIEKVFLKQPGAGRIEVNAQLGQMRLAWQRGSFDACSFARALQSLNYLVSPATDARSAAPESRAMLRRIGLCAAFAMNVMLFTLPSYFGMEASSEYARLFSTISMGFATLSLLAGGSYFLGKAARSLREGVMNIDLPIALGILGSYVGSFYGWLMNAEPFMYFDFVATFILLMLVGRWAQQAAVERNQRRLLAEQPTPDRIRVWDAQGRAKEISPEGIQAGQRFAVGRGHGVPVEARLESAEAVMSLAWINGESEPRLFRAGQRIPSGSINVTQAELQLTATQGWKDSLLAELFKPAERALYRNRFLERVIQGYLITVLLLAAGAAVAWWVATGDALRTGAVVTAVLVVSCPCAIGLAFPLADEMAALALRKRGVFVRTVDLWPRLERVRKLVFDKTGTLTLETPVLQNVNALCGLDETCRRALLALVQDNPHPVGRCLHEHLLAGVTPEARQGESNPIGYFRPSDTPLPGEVSETIGQGVALRSGEQLWTLGRPGWRGGQSNLLGYFESCAPSGGGGAESNPIGYLDPRGGGLAEDQKASGTVANEDARADAPEGGTELSCNGRVVAVFHFAEQARPDAREELEGLRKRELEAVILSGDRHEKVDTLTRELGLAKRSGFAGLTPHEKAEWIVQHGAEDTMMLGDGANDSLAFDKALCRGTPVIHRGMLAQKADFYYLGRGIGGIRALFEVNDRRRRTHAWLLAFSITYNLVAVGLALTGHMNPLLAAILMPASSLASLAIVLRGMRSVAKERIR